MKKMLCVLGLVLSISVAWGETDGASKKDSNDDGHCWEVSSAAGVDIVYIMRINRCTGETWLITNSDGPKWIKVEEPSEGDSP